MNTKLFSSKINALTEQYAPMVEEKCDVGQMAFSYTYKALEKIGGFKLCTRCGGSCILREFMHVDNGTCFKCNGCGWKKAGLDFEVIETLVKENPEKLVKLVNAQLKRETKATEKSNAKWKKLEEARAARQALSLTLVSPEDAAEFTAFIEHTKVIHSQYDYQSEELGEYEKLNGFLKNIYEQFTTHGSLSEKQIMAVVNSLHKDKEKAELLKTARHFSAGEKYQDVVAKVTKMERISVQVTAWATAMTTKVVLVGPNKEIFVIKTDNGKLLEKFEMSFEEKKDIVFEGTCKWVAPEGFPAVFTSRGLKVKI